MSSINSQIPAFSGPVRFEKNMPVSSLWKIAENLIDFGGKGRKVVLINKSTNAALITEDAGKKLSLNLIIAGVLKIVALAALYLSVIGGIAHASIILYNRSQHNFVNVPNELNKDIPFVIETFKSITEVKPDNYIDVLTNNKTSKIFEKNEINFMKNLKLKDMAFENIDDGLNFVIRNTILDESMEFSNRNPTMGELRGTVLRNILNQQDQKISLYDAIAKIINSTESDVYKYMLNSAARSNNDNSGLIKAIGDKFLSSGK